MTDEKKIRDGLGAEFVAGARDSVITDQMIARAMGKGTSWICAHCVKFWKGISMGSAQCMAVYLKKPCGGPISNMTFPEYEGPLPRSVFPSRCFVCGVTATAGLQVRGSEELIGVCKKHEEFVHQMRPFDPEKDKPPVPKIKALMEVPR